jgi:deazaflavin-dependent oxidoreductase (nitroreductase family)
VKVTIKLTTTGNRSGKPREVTLYAYEDDDRLIVVGSRGGAAKDPSWVRNLRAEPRATVRRGRKEHDVRAHEVDGQERERLWKLVTKEFPLYAAYQRKTERVIPLFALQQVGGSD